jgi:hypothetical protein
MKANSLIALFLLMVIVTLSSCELAGDIFQAGIWVGILAVVGIIALVFWLFGRRKP